MIGMIVTTCSPLFYFGDDEDYDVEDDHHDHDDLDKDKVKHFSGAFLVCFGSKLAILGNLRKT